MAPASSRLALLMTLLASFPSARAGSTSRLGRVREVLLDDATPDAPSAPRRAGPVPVPDASRPASPVVVPVWDVGGAPPDPASSSIPNLPSDAVAFDVRLDVQIPDTTLGAASREGLTEEFRLGKTLVWCKSFLVHDAAETIPSDSPDRVSGVGDVPVDALNVVAVEPAPGSPNVHHMHLHVCDDDSPAWRKHARMFSDVDDAEFGAGPTIGREPLACVPPSWDPTSGCRGTAWTFLPGQDGVLFPDGVGMKIGVDGASFDLRKLILEVHYDQAHEMNGMRDRSGLRFWAVPRDDAVRDRVGVLSVADPFARLPQSLPPGRSDVTYATHCPPGCTKTLAGPMRVFASMTHAHLRARHVITSLGTPGADGAVPKEGWRDVVDADDGAGAFSHDRQRFEPTNFTLAPGDSLRTTCRYDTSADDAPIEFGPATSQEMCMQVFLYYPKQPTFLCGYYSEEAYWCGDAAGTVRKEGADAEFHGEWCTVGEERMTCDEVNRASGFAR